MLPVSSQATTATKAAKNVTGSASAVGARARTTVCANCNLTGFSLTLTAHIAAGAYANRIGQCQRGGTTCAVRPGTQESQYAHDGQKNCDCFHFTF